MKKNKSDDPCGHLGKYFQSRYDKELSSREEGMVSEHLQSCTSCQKRYRQVSQVNQFVKNAFSQLPPLATKEKVQNQLQDDSPSQSPKKKDALFEIGGYKVLEKIGQGSMGTVYKAIQLSLRRIVALKILSSKHLENENYIQRFFREARAAASLQHPNIVQVYDVGQEKKAYYFSMEYVEGETVAHILDREKRLSINKALNIVIQIARALAHAEKTKIVHRDIKPDNIIIDQYGVARLADMGMAKKLTPIESEISDENPSLTKIGAIMGTPEYMSPEQATNAKKVTTQTDVYSLGATFYHLITGRPPFTGETLMEILSNVLHERIHFHPEEDKNIPISVQRVIKKMMAKSLDERYQSGEELLRALLDLRNRMSTGTGTGLLQVDSTFLPPLRGDTTSFMLNQSATILGKKTSKKPPNLPFAYFMSAVIAFGALVLIWLFFSSTDPALEKYREVARFARKNPGHIEEVSRQWKELAQNHPQSFWGKEAKVNSQRLQEKKAQNKFNRQMTKIVDLLCQGKLHRAYEKCQNLLQRLEGTTLEKHLKEFGHSIQERRDTLFSQKLYELKRASTYVKAKTLVDEIENFASSMQQKEAHRVFQENQDKYKSF